MSSEVFHLCSFWSPGGLSPCPVSQLLETPACPPRWPHRTPRPGEHTQNIILSIISSEACDQVLTSRLSPHVCVDGLGEGSVPIVDDAVDLRLDQKLRPLTSLQLREEREANGHIERYQRDSCSPAKRDSGSTVASYLDDVLLARLVLGGPVH